MTGTILNNAISRRFRLLVGLSAVLPVCGPVQADPALFQSRQVTRAGEYTFGIEGPAVDAAGNLYVVNFQKAGTIGRLRPNAPASELFATLPDGSIGNSIRFSPGGRMFIADWKKHNIFVMSLAVPFRASTFAPMPSTSRTT